MNLAAIMSLLGVASEDEIAPAISKHQNLVAALQAKTGKKTADEILAAVTVDQDIASEVRELTGAETTPAILGVVEGWKASADRVTEIEAKAKADEESRRQAELKALIDERCPPSRREKVEALAARGFSNDDIREYLDNLGLPAAPTASFAAPGTGGRITQANPGGQAMQLTEEEKEVARLTGKSEKWMLEAKQLWSDTSSKSAGRSSQIEVGHTIELNKKMERGELKTANPSFNYIPCRSGPRAA